MTARLACAAAVAAGGLMAALAAVGCAPEPASTPLPTSAAAWTAPAAWALPADRTTTAYGTGGMVATTDRVATEVGVEILRRGGNAVDAAVATHFALASVNPEAGNIGGGGFMIVRTAAGETAALDFREKAPGLATREMFLDAQGAPTDRSRAGYLASGVPGSVAGMWEAHRRFGSLSWTELVQPAIHLADGIVVHARLAGSLQAYENRLRRYPATAAAFLPGGRAPRVGERLVQSDLAATLRRIAVAGADGFYRGRTADLIDAEMRRGGGLITRDDLAGYRAVWREPLLFQYRSHTIASMPPSSSGGVALAAILNVLEGYDVAGWGLLSRDHAHVWAEAAKRAFADRNAYLADPDFVEQPTAVLISDEYATRRRGEIDLHAATPSARVLPGLGSADAPAGPAESHDTTHYSIVDGAGMAAAVTTTINSLYGNLVTVDGAGFLLNNEMDDFTVHAGAPNQFGVVQGEGNAVGPHKRMLSSMTPVVVLDPSGRVRLVTGSPGGPTIITTVAQMISNVVDFGMSLGAATSAPRLHHQHLPDTLYYERGGLAPEVVAGLESIGHHLEERNGYQGDTQSILVLPDGTLSGVSDPRRGGAAASVLGRRDVVQ